ncbi:MAG: aquaporin Z [Gemmataceae bacterium]|nr:aquaporin Z [Gemmataceae bacterium]
MLRKVIAELIGTFWLTFGGCGSAVLAALFLTSGQQVPINLGIGLVGVSLAFGLTVLTMAYAIGHISGCHLNPAVTIGLVIGKRFPSAQALPYIGGQVLGAVLGAFVLYMIASGSPGFKFDNVAGAFATNGYDAYSPGKYSLLSCLAAEVVLTFAFLFIIMGATDKRAPAGFAPITIGLGLTLIHLIGIPVTNLSVNPARSTGPAVVAAINGLTPPVEQLWLFWLAPILGAVAGAAAYNFIATEPATPAPAAPTA